ncbi:MAG: histidine phosphatase family protein [Candidatus Dojkabacteria bacterium]
MKFIIFRHGQRDKLPGTDFEMVHYQIGLTEQGIGEIELLAEELKAKYRLNSENTLLYSSPMPRAVQSAEIVRQRLGLARFYLSKSFEETYIVRDYSGSIEENIALEHYYYSHPDEVDEHSGFSYNMLVDRVFAQLREIAEQEIENVLVSAHGGVVRHSAFRVNPEIKPEVHPPTWDDIPTGAYSVFNYDKTTDNFTLEEHAIKPG